MATSRNFVYQRLIEGEAPFRWQTRLAAMIEAYGEAYLSGYCRVHPELDRSQLLVEPAADGDEEYAGFTTYYEGVAISSMTEKSFLFYVIEGLIHGNS